MRVSALVLLLLGGCTYLTGRPSYELVSVERFTDRLATHDAEAAKKGAKSCVCSPSASYPSDAYEEEDPCPLPDGWIQCFMNQAHNLPVWEPEPAKVTDALNAVAALHGVAAVPERLKLVEALTALLKQSLGPVPVSDAAGHQCQRRVLHRAREMLKRVDLEHPDLLVSKDRLKPIDLGSRSHPLMLGTTEPVGVSLTPVLPSSEEKAEKKDPAQVVIHNSVFGGAAPKKEEASGDPLIKKQKFDPIQQVDVTLSTVLNSPDTLDRIQYVSTYVYFYPFQSPGHAEVDLATNLWHAFFKVHLARSSTWPPTMKPELYRYDLERALDAMRVRIRNVATTVKVADVDSGTVKRTAKDSFGIATPQSGSEHPELKSPTPGLSFNTEAGSEATVKLFQQLDQRSTYISPSANFLRITQRGMTAVNLAGRFNEKIVLHVPASSGTRTSLVPGKDGKVEVHRLTEPLYSRLDALTFSIVVVRHPTCLRRSTTELFGLPDLISAADSAFVVGVTRPYRVTLWTWERELFRVQQSDLLGHRAANGDEFVPTGEAPGSLLHLAGATLDEALQLLAVIRGELMKQLPANGQKTEVEGIGQDAQGHLQLKVKGGPVYTIAPKPKDTTVKKPDGVEEKKDMPPDPKEKDKDKKSNSGAKAADSPKQTASQAEKTSP